MLFYLLRFSLQCEGIDGEADDIPHGAVYEPGLSASLAVQQAAGDKEVKEARSFSLIRHKNSDGGISRLLPVVTDDINPWGGITRTVWGHVTGMYK